MLEIELLEYKAAGSFLPSSESIVINMGAACIVCLGVIDIVSRQREQFLMPNEWVTPKIKEKENEYQDLL